MKTQINKSEIFRAAWNYKRENNWTLSAALKVAWKEAKNPSTGIKDLENFLGHSFYAAYLTNGHTMILCQYGDKWMLFNERVECVETDIKGWTEQCTFDNDVEAKGYKHAAAMFYAEGNRIEFKA